VTDTATDPPPPADVDRAGARRVALVIALAATAVIANWLPAPDAAANAYLADAMTGNLVIYASARALNGIISVIQSIEIGISIGAGVSVNLGEVLDPLNDLIERFSSFILVVLAALGVQKLVLLAASSFAMKCVTTVAIAAAAMATWQRHLRLGWLIRIAGVIVLARFIFVAEVGVVATLDRVYFDDATRHAKQALVVAREDLSRLRERYFEAARKDGMLSGAVDTVMRIVGNEGEDGIAGLAANAVTGLIAILFVRTLVFPVLFLWLLVAGSRWLLNPASNVTGARP